jgi:hypothetical protein
MVRGVKRLFRASRSLQAGTLALQWVKLSMQHRHLKTTNWTLEAIDSALERGNLEDWRELFSEARNNKVIAAKIMTISVRRDLGGTSELAKELVTGIYPDLSLEK